MSNPHQASLGKLVRDMLLRHPNGKAVPRNAVAYGSSFQDDIRLFRELYRQGRADRERARAWGWPWSTAL